MPCNTIQTSTVDIGKLNPELAQKALEALGIAGYYSNGKLVTQGSVDVSQVKQAYSAEVVKSQARKFGWTLKQTEQFKYQIVKR